MLTPIERDNKRASCSIVPHCLLASLSVCLSVCLCAGHNVLNILLFLNGLLISLNSRWQTQCRRPSLTWTRHHFMRQMTIAEQATHFNRFCPAALPPTTTPTACLLACQCSGHVLDCTLRAQRHILYEPGQSVSQFWAAMDNSKIGRS